VRLWIVGGLAALYFLCGGRRIARSIDWREWRAFEEFGDSVAPLVLIALVWLLAEPMDTRKVYAGRQGE
jgi:hypothetical protein